MSKKLLHVIRGAIAWMVAAAILDGISGLLLAFVIFNWSTGSYLPLIYLIISSLITFWVTFIATQKGYLAGGAVMRYLANTLIHKLPLLLKPAKESNNLLVGPATHAMSTPAHLLHPMISGMVTPFTVIIGAMVYQFLFGGLLLIIYLTLIFILRFCANHIAHTEHDMQTSQQAVSNALDEFATHQPLIRKADKNHAQKVNLTLALKYQYNTQKQLQNKSLPFHLFFSLSIQIIFISLFCVGLFAVLGSVKHHNAPFTLDMWLAGMLLLARFIEPLWLLSHLDQSLRQAKKAIHQIDRVLKREELVFPHSSLYPNESNIHCNNICYYSDNKKRILNDINITFIENKLTAIVGSSGAGKSTLLSLLARLQDPTEGTIYYGGIDATKLSQEVLCRKRGLLFQDSHLFLGSLRENLIAGSHNIDDREIMSMLSQLNINIDNVSLGGNVGSGGKVFSGGQLQRLCIARLFLSHPDIILMDEPTASLDYINTASVAHLLTSASQQTRIIVTHQPMLAQRADHIIHMENGRIIAQGTHTELIEKDYWYQQFIHQTISA